MLRKPRLFFFFHPMEFLKLSRDPLVDSLLVSDPLAFVLLTVIARRAKREADPILGLEVGECFLGDYRNYGMSEAQYRLRKIKLEKWGLVSTRTTNRGTIAKLVNKRVYDINEKTNSEPNNTQQTDRQQTDNRQTTTNKNSRIKELKNNTYPPTPQKKEIKKTEVPLTEKIPSGKIIHDRFAFHRYEDVVLLAEREGKDSLSLGQRVLLAWNSQCEHLPRATGITPDTARDIQLAISRHGNEPIQQAVALYNRVMGLENTWHRYEYNLREFFTPNRSTGELPVEKFIGKTIESFTLQTH